MTKLEPLTHRAAQSAAHLADLGTQQAHFGAPHVVGEVLGTVARDNGKFLRHGCCCNRLRILANDGHILAVAQWCNRYKNRRCTCRHGAKQDKRKHSNRFHDRHYIGFYPAANGTKENRPLWGGVFFILGLFMLGHPEHVGLHHALFHDALLRILFVAFQDRILGAPLQAAANPGLLPAKCIEQQLQVLRGHRS
jgi:hypothetical protein